MGVAIWLCFVFTLYFVGLGRVARMGLMTCDFLYFVMSDWIGEDWGFKFLVVLDLAERGVFMLLILRILHFFKIMLYIYYKNSVYGRGVLRALVGLESVLEVKKAVWFIVYHQNTFYLCGNKIFFHHWLFMISTCIMRNDYAPSRLMQVSYSSRISSLFNR